jgi:protein gp37
MADNSKIEWTDATWNPVTGCSVLSPGCTNCYAMNLAGTRLRNHPSRAGLTIESKAGPVWNGKVRFNEGWLTQPLEWKKPRMVFVCAHGDLFHENVPDEWIDQVFAVMALCPQHTFQVLTKRAERMRDYFAQGREKMHTRWLWAARDALPITFVGSINGTYPLPNVWLGVSTERQKEYDERKEHLRNTPAAVRFFSVEPLLGPIKADYLGDWVIVGGESGHGARPMHPDWARSLRDQCATAGVPFFFKQWGAWSEFYDRDRDDPDWRNVPKVDQQMGPGAERWHNLAGGIGFHGERLVAMRNVGKGVAGRLLDGIEHNGMPRAA